MGDGKMREFLDVLKELIRQPSVVGSEHSFFRVIQKLAEERGAAVTWYEGLLVAQGKRPERALVSAHVDRHGLVCTGPNEFQYAAFVAGGRSDLLGNSVSEIMLNKVADRYLGLPVWAYEPWSGSYLGSAVITNSYVCEFRRNLVFEVDGLEHVVAGTPVALHDKLLVSNERITGQLDNVVTVAALIHAFALGFEGTAFFTAQEESGKSWRYLLEWFRRSGKGTDDLIVVDTSPFENEDAAFGQDLVLRKGDVNAAFSHAATEKISAVCESKGYSYLFKDDFVRESNEIAIQEGKSQMSLGSTELGRIAAASDGAVNGTTLQIPTTGYHTLQETSSIRACDSFLNVLLDVGGD